MTERQKAIYTSTTVGNGLFVFGIVILILFILNASFLLVAGKDSRALALILCACWVIGVPIFFFIEHAFFFRKWGDVTQFDQFKRLQDQAAKIWAAATRVPQLFAPNHVGTQ